MAVEAIDVDVDVVEGHEVVPSENWKVLQLTDSK